MQLPKITVANESSDHGWAFIASVVESASSPKVREKVLILHLLVFTLIHGRKALLIEANPESYKLPESSRL